MSVLTIPNSFSPNTTISSSLMNANFSAISTFFNSTGINDANITPAGVSHVSLALASVQKDTLNTNVVDGTTLTGGAGTALGILPGGVAVVSLAAAVAQALNPAGAIAAFIGVSAPAGYLLCNGAAVSRASYATLFGVMGVSCGSGDGTTTFNLPDLRGQFLRGVTGASANDPDFATRTAMAAGGATGNQPGSVQADNVGPHVHSYSLLNSTGASPTAAAGSGTTLGSTGNVNTNGTTETRPKNAYVNFLIKT